MKKFSLALTSLLLLESTALVAQESSSQKEASNQKVVPEGDVKAATNDPAFTLDANAVVPSEVASPETDKIKQEIPLLDAEKPLPTTASSSVAEPATVAPNGPLPASKPIPRPGAKSRVAEKQSAKAVEKSVPEMPSQGPVSTSEVISDLSKQSATQGAVSGVGAVSNVGTAQGTAAEGAPNTVAISDGSRVALEGKGFSMKPPAGWNVRKDLPRTSLFMQPANLGAEEYPRNISVLKFSGPMPINEIAAEKFGNYLVKNFPMASAEIADYQLRNHQSVKMDDEREGILFYTDFNVRGKPMMQANILVSSQTAHYLISYTDIAENLDSPQTGNESFANAWKAMTSIELDTANPQPLESVQWGLFAGVGLLVVFGMVAFFRQRSASAFYRNYSEMEPGEAAELDPKTHALSNESVQSVISVVEDDKSKIIEFPGKKKTETSDAWALGKSKIVSGEDPVSLESEELPRDKWKVS